MSDVEEPRFNSLADRIKALNQQKNFSAPLPTAPPAASPSDALAVRKSRPPPPPPPVTATRQPTASTTTIASPPAPPPRPNAPPALPARSSTAPTTRAPPPLPQRAPSFQLQLQPQPQLPPPTSTGRVLAPPPRPSASTRRTSSSSERSFGSQYSTATSIDSSTSASARKLPPAFDPSTLPALPPTKKERANAAIAAKALLPRLPAASSTTTPAATPLPKPQLPLRRPTNPVAAPALPTRRLPPPPPARPQPPAAPPTLPSRPKAAPVADDAPPPPPIPLMSKPTHASTSAAKQRLHEPAAAAAAAAEPQCLYCRDFSAPDLVATQYPRQSVPQQDPIGFLAHALCSPFTSATDKARAIFTWHHHNIDYDWASFSAGCVRPATAADVIISGRAVCAGYAQLYEAIARRAGLQCITVSGHGKGIGWADIEPDEPLPPRDVSGHAWNAVQIDGGQWKLVDACWGSGACSNGRYTRHFRASEFSAPNEVFGLKHFPSDAAHWFRRDGRAPTWAEYVRGRAGAPGPTLCGRFDDEGLGPASVGPARRDICVAGREALRLQVARACVCGCAHGPREEVKRMLALMVRVRGEWVAMQTDGFWWWLDVYPGDLGAAGETVMLAMPKEVDGRAVSGMTVEEYKKGFRSIGFDGLVLWRLV